MRYHLKMRWCGPPGDAPPTRAAFLPHTARSCSSGFEGAGDPYPTTTADPMQPGPTDTPAEQQQTQQTCACRQFGRTTLCLGIAAMPPRPKGAVSATADEPRRARHLPSPICFQHAPAERGTELVTARHDVAAGPSVRTDRPTNPGRQGVTDTSTRGPSHLARIWHESQDSTLVRCRRAIRTRQKSRSASGGRGIRTLGMFPSSGFQDHASVRRPTRESLC